MMLVRHEAAERRNESCQPLIALQLASVVTVANRAEFAMPKRHSLPSMFLPDERAVTV
jgi:hypothetical protein